MTVWGAEVVGGFKYCPIYIEFNLKLTKCLLLIDLGPIGSTGGWVVVCVPKSFILGG